VIEARAGRGEILVPSIGCAAIAQIIYCTGFTPRWVDVNLRDYTLEAAALERAITPQTRGILPVHLFGHACDMDRVMDVARRHKLLVIEDAAQSLGGTWKGRPLGSVGDLGVFSFGGDKIVNAGGGGALVTNDDDLAAQITPLLGQLPTYNRTPDFALRSLSHRNLYHAVVDLLRADNDLRLEQVFRTAMPYYRQLYREQFPHDDAIGASLASALASLQPMLARRIARAERYHELLSSLPLDTSEAWRTSRTLWRYTFLAHKPAEAQLITRSLRANKIHASNHYWSLADLFDGEKALPNTRYFCPRVVNLWVDEVADETYIRKSCSVIAEALQPRRRTAVDAC
jgi:dTDP-4-amino-4,6-dideoxygalactose transaminase